MLRCVCVLWKGLVWISCYEYGWSGLMLRAGKELVGLRVCLAVPGGLMRRNTEAGPAPSMHDCAVLCSMHDCAVTPTLTLRY